MGKTFEGETAYICTMLVIFNYIFMHACTVRDCGHPDERDFGHPDERDCGHPDERVVR